MKIIERKKDVPQLDGVYTVGWNLPRRWAVGFCLPMADGPLTEIGHYAGVSESTKGWTVRILWFMFGRGYKP